MLTPPSDPPTFFDYLQDVGTYLFYTILGFSADTLYVWLQFLNFLPSVRPPSDYKVCSNIGPDMLYLINSFFFFEF